MERDILEILKSYDLKISDAEVKANVKTILDRDFESLYTIENLKKNFSFIDLTTLNSTDTHAKAKSFADNVNNFQNDFDMPNVAAICVYPYQVPTLNENLKAKGVRIASVAGVFPSSQSYVEVKALECKMAVEKGANDIDIVISIGAFLEGHYQTVFDEITIQKEACGKAGPVILEPIMKVEVVTPEEYMGDIIGDLNKRRGQIEGMETKHGARVVVAKVPLSEQFGYVTVLRTLSSGRANSSMEFSHFEDVPKGIAKDVVEAAKGKVELL